MPAHQLGAGVGVFDLNDQDRHLLNKYVQEYGVLFDVDVSSITADEFKKLAPLSARPYKQLYAY